MDFVLILGEQIQENQRNTFDLRLCIKIKFIFGYCIF